MTQERFYEIDAELSFIISCLYQRGEYEMALTFEQDIKELLTYINELEKTK